MELHFLKQKFIIYKYIGKFQRGEEEEEGERGERVHGSRHNSIGSILTALHQLKLQKYYLCCYLLCLFELNLMMNIF